MEKLQPISTRWGFYLYSTSSQYETHKWEAESRGQSSSEAAKIRSDISLSNLQASVICDQHRFSKVNRVKQSHESRTKLSVRDVHLNHILFLCPQCVRDSTLLGQILGGTFCCWDTLELSHIPVVGFWFFVSTFHSRSLAIWLFVLQLISSSLVLPCASRPSRVMPLGCTQKVTQQLLRTATHKTATHTGHAPALQVKTPRCAKLWVPWKTPQRNRVHKLPDDWDEHEGLLTPMHVLVMQDQQFHGTHSRLGTVVKPGGKKR